jgi:Homeodomain-like domain
MTVVTMSRAELARVETLARLRDGSLSVAGAAALLGRSRRQVFRLLRRLRSEGAAGLASRRRGRPGNHRLPDALREAALALVRERYADFGPTLAAEKLAERHGIGIGRETLRLWMIAAGLWVGRKARPEAVHQPRPRRDCSGELVQIDGCEHWWFEGRGPRCTLLAFVDDATSRLMHARLVPSESALAYLQATREYVTAYGKPIAFYSDRHSIFRVNRPDAPARGDGMTQFGRALHDLDIAILCASTCQAKGRVERALLTLQDRLVKELRLAGIGTIEAANRFLPGFIADYNRRFAKPPRDDRDLHRPLAPYEDLDEALAWREQRTVTANLTLHYNKVLFLLETSRISRAAARQRVTVYDYPDGRLAIRWKGVDLPYRAFDKLRVVDQAAVVDDKRLGAALAYAQRLQGERARKRNGNLTRKAQAPGLMSL